MKLYMSERSITGAVPRVEAQKAHESFIAAVKPEFAMLSIDHARRVCKRGETGATYFPTNTSVITTTTIADDRLDRLSWEDEYEIVREFGPEYHIPTDYAVYGDDPREKRLECAENCATGTVWMSDQFEENDISTSVLPLIKGSDREEREFGYRACSAVESDMAAIYATQYFTAGGGGGRSALVRDVKGIAEETDGELELIVVGLLSPNYLSAVPTTVVAAAGQRTWREAVAPRERNATAIRDNYRTLRGRIEQALRDDPDEENDDEGD